MGEWDRSSLEDWTSMEQLKGEGSYRGGNTVQKGL